MDNYRATLEALATRGEVRGSTAVLAAAKAEQTRRDGPLVDEWPTPQRRSTSTRRRTRRALNGWLVAAAAFTVVVVAVGGAALVGSQPSPSPQSTAGIVRDAPSTTASTVPDVTSTSTSSTMPSEQEWPWIGTPISDGEWNDLFGLPIVPGSGVRIAWIEQGEFSLGLFGAFEQDTEGLTDGYPAYPCLYSYGADSHGVFGGGSQCSLNVEDPSGLFEFGVGGGGTCTEPIRMMASVWGVPASTDVVTFHLNDGTDIDVEPVDGVALAAWTGDRRVDSADVPGITDDQAEYLTTFYASNQASCAELNDPDIPG